jgi:hypothetical protein
MIDAIAVVISCTACLFVAWRAVTLDRRLPWFGKSDEVGRTRYRATRNTQ